MDGKYKTNVIECDKWSSFIKLLVGRNITVLSKTELDHVRFEYGDNVIFSEISNGDEIYDVWNQLDDETGPKKNAENLPELVSLIMREGWWYQESRQMNRNMNFHTTNKNLM